MAKLWQTIRTPGWMMNRGTRNLMEVLGMKGRTCFPLLLAGLFLLIVSFSLVACAAPKVPTHISTEPEQLSFAAKAGDNALSEPLEIHSSAADEPLTWEAEDDALWLKVSPSQGTFDCGVSEAVVWVYTSGLSVGHHSATISISVPEADNSPLTLSVELYLEKAEDPAVAAAREFWESNTYKRYWDLNASSDVRDTVRSYEFPPPGETKATSQEVEIKNIEFEYNPAIHERPIATVHCIITWHRTYPDPSSRFDYMLETWTWDADVVLQVQPAPYSTDHNEWEVVDYYRHSTERVEPTVPPPATPEPIPQAPTAQIMYQDDFSDRDSGWYTASWEECNANYEDGEYYILMKKMDWSCWFYNRNAGYFTAFALEVDARLVSGPESGSYGVIFRVQDEDNFYRFLVCGDGSYSVEKRINGTWTKLHPETKSAFIQEGYDTTNQLKVVCQDSQIDVYVNGYYLTTVTDYAFPGGSVGMVADTDEPNLRVAFDNIKVYSLD